MSTLESTQVRLWLSPEEIAEREQQRLAAEYQADAIAEAMSEEIDKRLRMRAAPKRTDSTKD